MDFLLLYGGLAMQDKLVSEHDLISAIANEEFVLHYQPVVRLSTNAVCGFEALVRWRHPDRGIVGPDAFIPLAEQSGVIVPLGEWILRRACHDAAQWPDRFRLAVNVSPTQLRHADFAQVVERALRDSGCASGRLELEVTETAILVGGESIASLALLQVRDVGIVIDDFGTGYASLENLVAFPFNTIKIDRAFVAGLPYGRSCRAIVAAIAGLARGLDIDVTAEGVETAEQLAILTAAGCTNGQGYYFAPPRPLAEIDFGTGETAASARLARVMG